MTLAVQALYNRPQSPELVYLACPDCRYPCKVSFAALVTNGKMVWLTVCPICHDHQTVRVWFDLQPYEVVDMHDAGMVMFNYQERK